MKQNTNQMWETKINKLLSNLLALGIVLIIISLPMNNISTESLSNGNGKYTQEWIGGPIAAIGIVILAAVFASKKVVYESENNVNKDNITKKSILWGFIYSIAFIIIVLVLATVVMMIFFFLADTQKYSQTTVVFSSLSNYSILASIFLSLAFSPVLATWVTKKKVELKNEYYNQKLTTARNYEYAMNYDAAIAIYEELGLWDDAKRCREKKALSVQR